MDNEQGLIIYNTPDGRSKVALMARDGMVWLNQQSIAELFGTSIPNISIHISNIFRDKELDRDSVVKDYLTTAADGKPYHVMFYSLPMILAIGYKVKGIRGVQFRRWATEHLSEYLVKGFTMDDERLKNPDGIYGLQRKDSTKRFVTCLPLAAITIKPIRQPKCSSLRHRTNFFMP